MLDWQGQIGEFGGEQMTFLPPFLRLSGNRKLIHLLDPEALKRTMELTVGKFLLLLCVCTLAAANSVLIQSQLDFSDYH